MRILMLMNRVPYPAHDGGAIALLNMLKGFSALRQDVYLLCLNTRKHYVNPKTLPSPFTDITHFDTANIDTEIRPWQAFTNLFSSESYNIVRFYSETYEDKLIKLLKSRVFDIVHIENLPMTLYIDTIRRYSNAYIVMRAHNVEHLIWERMAAAEKNPLKKWYVNLLARRMKTYELGILNKLDAIVPITGVDEESLRQLGCQRPMHVSPTGLDIDRYEIDHSGEEWPSVFHLGALNWMPNQQAVRWFLDEIWPLVHQRYPEVNFYLAGRHMPDWLKERKQAGVQVVGEVADAVSFMNSRSIMVVPLTSGSGMRIKIIEGMAMAKAIVSTSIGAEGIDCTHEKNILIADTAEAFAYEICRCIDDKSLAVSLGREARALAAEQYHNPKIISDLLSFYKSLLQWDAPMTLDQMDV